MTTLRHVTPTVRQLTDAWSRKFAEVVSLAGGKDGVVTVAAALRIAERRDGGRLWSDNAVGYLRAKGQKSVRSGKLVAAGRRRLERHAARVAGNNGLVSLVEIRRLARDLRADALYLRGKGPVDPEPLSPEKTRELVTRLVLAALDQGSAEYLGAAPRIVRGRRPVVDNIPHPASRTRAIAYLANHVIYISRASPSPSPLVGWYRVGSLPL